MTQDPDRFHNISDKEIQEKGIPIHEALDKFLAFVANDPLIFHNAPL